MTHAQNCKRGGNMGIRHDTPESAVAICAMGALGRSTVKVEKEAWLRKPGERAFDDAAPPETDSQAAARLASARGEAETRGLRVDVQQLFNAQIKEKRALYEKECKRQGTSLKFVPSCHSRSRPTSASPSQRRG